MLKKYKANLSLSLDVVVEADVEADDMVSQSYEVENKIKTELDKYKDGVISTLNASAFNVNTKNTYFSLTELPPTEKTVKIPVVDVRKVKPNANQTK